MDIETSSFKIETIIWFSLNVHEENIHVGDVLSLDQVRTIVLVKNRRF